MSLDVLLNTSFPSLTLLSRGKVRDIYETSNPTALLFVATDRISAFDVILRNGVPDKGRVLTDISFFWFKRLYGIIPNHFITSNVDEMPQEVQEYKDQLRGRSMLVRKAEVVPLEAIVRGYITGSAWSEYKRTGTVHGMEIPTGLVESQKLGAPLFTPSTKAEQGAHDENISPESAVQLIGQELCDLISKAALELYLNASEYAAAKGVILADTKFEFGLLPGTESLKDRLILIDEVLTPDSSRYWPADKYAPGRGQESFDKQYLRDWLLQEGFKKGSESGPPGKEGEGWVMTPEVVARTRDKYLKARELLIN